MKQLSNEMLDILTIIPVHNFIEGLYKITEWINSEYPTLFNSYKVIIVNDNSDPRYLKDFKKIILSNKHFIYKEIEKNKQKDLQYSLNFANSYQTQLINIIETDAIPNTKVFMNMIKTYSFIKDGIASVSPMYTWENRYCYPTHSHWKTDGLNIKGGRFKIDGIGEIAKVGEAGVPFLFSIWNPVAFKHINNEKFRKFLNLDSDFGKYVHSLGFHHYRLLENNIEHYKKGKASRNG